MLTAQAEEKDARNKIRPLFKKSTLRLNINSSIHRFCSNELWQPSECLAQATGQTKYTVLHWIKLWSWSWLCYRSFCGNVVVAVVMFISACRRCDFFIVRQSVCLLPFFQRSSSVFTCRFDYTLLLLLRAPLTMSNKLHDAEGNIVELFCHRKPMRMNESHIVCVPKKWLSSFTAECVWLRCGCIECVCTINVDFLS